MATIEANFRARVAVHPCELIKDEMQARGLKQKELAALLGMKAPNLHSLLKERRAITPALANKLSQALSIPADFWLSMQARYDRDAQAQPEAIEAQQVQPDIDVALSLLREMNSIRTLLEHIDSRLSQAYVKLDALSPRSKS